jgi:hypothetical protein
MKLSDLTGRVRREKISDALEIVLRQIVTTATTSEIVTKVGDALGVPKGELPIIAKIVVQIGTGHRLCRLTGETFERYGKTMQRREWLPSHAKPRRNAPIRLSDGEIARRRAAIEEAEDPWTVHPEPSFLEDDDEA